MKQKISGVFCCLLLVILFIYASSPVVASSDPTIHLLNVPPYGSRVENLTGVILNGSAFEYQIGVYIFVNGWRAKKVKINNDGYWISDITTQDNDWEATHIAVFLFRKNFDMPILKNDKILPTSLFENAIIHEEVIRQPMTTRSSISNK